MEKLHFVTSNKGKILSAQEQFKSKGINLFWLNHDCKEPNINDIEEISKYKVIEAYNIIKEPCFVIDSGFYIDNYPNNPGFPGAFVRRELIDIKDGIDLLLDKMKNVKNRNCKFVDCLTYYDGKKIETFYGISEGNLSYEKKGNYSESAKSDLWFVFCPKNCIKTLAEMSNAEISSRNDNKTSAILEFINWYTQNVLNNSSLNKTKTLSKN